MASGRSPSHETPSQTAPGDDQYYATTAHRTVWVSQLMVIHETAPARTRWRVWVRLVRAHRPSPSPRSTHSGCTRTRRGGERRATALNAQCRYPDARDVPRRTDYVRRLPPRVNVVCFSRADAVPVLSSYCCGGSRLSLDQATIGRRLDEDTHFCRQAPVEGYWAVARRATEATTTERNTAEYGVEEERGRSSRE